MTEVDLMIRSAGSFDLAGMELSAILGMAVLGKRFKNEIQKNRFKLLTKIALATSREELDPLIDRIREETTL